MLAVSDTTPINYLLHIRGVHSLAKLFDEVVIPGKVGRELVKPGGPLTDIARIGFPERVEGVRLVEEKLRSPTDASDLKRLDDGEREAILLAEKLNVDIVLMDEREGRNVAKGHGLQPKGTLGILDEAGREGVVDVPEMVEELRETNFHASPELYEWLLARHR